MAAPGTIERNKEIVDLLDEADKVLEPFKNVLEKGLYFEIRDAIAIKIDIERKKLDDWIHLQNRLWAPDPK